MPTIRPRYTVTDTGETTELLDLAQRVWPEITDRRQLLLRLTHVGGEALQAQLAEQQILRDQQRASLESGTALVDVDELLSDIAWR